MTLVAILLAAAAAYGQINPTGTLDGEVRDGTGAVLPMTQVTLENKRTGGKRTTTTTEQGVYYFNLIQPGTYAVGVERPGFKRYSQTVTIEAGRKLTVNLALAVGDVTERVEVQGDAPMIETSTASITSTVNQKFLTELPMSGRNALTLAWLAPGVVQFTAPLDTYGLDNRTGVGYFSANGANQRQNEVLMDGVPNRHYDTAAYLPPADQVQEIAIQTNAFDAEYGHGGGAYVSVTTRSGGNAIHGSVYEYFRNDKLNANNFFSNRAGLGRPALRFHQFGAAVGGPVWKNRTFWFFNYEGVRNRAPRTVLFTVPTAAQRAGDFSQTLDNRGVLVQIFDPFTTRANPAAAGRSIRTQFPGNRVPASLFDPAARSVLEAFTPLPNREGDPFTGTNNVAEQKVAVNDLNNYTIRLDHHIGQRHRLFGRQSRSKKYELQVRIVDAGGDHYVDLAQESAGLGDTITFSPTTTLVVNAGVTRYSLGGYKPTVDLAKFGFANSFIRSLQQSKIPRIMNSDMALLGAEGGDRYDNGYQYSFSTTLSQYRGRHNFKAGFQFQLRQNNSIGSNSPSGSFTFDRSFTQGPDPNTRGATVGHGIASYLLGTAASGLTTFNIATAHQTPYYGLYFQDDVRLTSRLTLNAGIRYDLKLPSTERFNNMSRWAFVTPNPIEDAARAAYARNPIPELPASAFRTTGGLLFATPEDRRAARADRNDWSPRIGLAFRVNDKTVLRAGYGLFFDYWSVGDFSSDGFSSSTPMLATLDDLRPANLLANPFPSGLLPPPGRSQGLRTLLGTAFQIFPDQDRTPYNSRWQAGIQREAMRDLRVEVNYVGETAQSTYVGNRGGGSNGEMSQTLRFLPQQYLPLGARLQSTVPNPFLGLIPSDLALGRPTIAVQNLLATVPHMSDLVIRRRTGGRTYYHGLQSTVTKRYSHGVQLLATYTFQRQIERLQYLNDSDPLPAKTIGALWTPHRATVAGVWELPFGKGRRFDWDGLAGKIVGGWQLNLVYTFQSGFALLLPDIAYNAGADVRLSPSERNVDRWFNTAAFRVLPAFTLRDLSVRTARLQGDAINNSDLSLAKTTSVNERLNLQFRCELFNAFNRAQFGAPNLTPNAGAYGRITSQANAARAIQLGLRLGF